MFPGSFGGAASRPALLTVWSFLPTSESHPHLPYPPPALLVPTFPSCCCLLYTVKKNFPWPKKKYKWAYLETRKRLTDLREQRWLQGKDGGRDHQGVWTDMCTRLYLEWVSVKDLHDSVQRYVAAWMEGEFWGECVHAYDWVPLLFTWNYHNIVC